MTNQEILEKAIQKAISNGYPENKFKVGQDRGATEEYIIYFGEAGNYRYRSSYRLIFSHDFAKALWGEQETSSSTPEEHRGQYTGASGDYGAWVTKDGWQHHLQQMVIADNPIKYLGENI
jgi:hypothetical protein